MCIFPPGTKGLAHIAARYRVVKGAHVVPFLAVLSKCIILAIEASCCYNISGSNY